MVRVAVIDDDAAFIDVMIDALELRRWQACPYEAAESLLPLLRAERPDVIVLDLRFRGRRSGWDYLADFRQDPILRHIPVIICSASLDELRAKAAWMDEQGIPALEKPFELDTLHAMIETALWRAHSRRLEAEGA